MKYIDSNKFFCLKRKNIIQYFGYTDKHQSCSTENVSDLLKRDIPFESRKVKASVVQVSSSL
jgi:hypothetical protein